MDQLQRMDAIPTRRACGIRINSQHEPTSISDRTRYSDADALTCRTRVEAESGLRVVGELRGEVGREIDHAVLVLARLVPRQLGLDIDVDHRLGGPATQPGADPPRGGRNVMPT